MNQPCTCPSGVPERPALFACRGLVGLLALGLLLNACSRVTPLEAPDSNPSQAGTGASAAGARSMSAGSISHADAGAVSATAGAASTPPSATPSSGVDAGMPLSESGDTFVTSDAAVGQCTSGTDDAGVPNGVSNCILPRSHCLDARRLAFFANPRCDLGRCVWAELIMTCPQSCTAGSCGTNITL